MNNRVAITGIGLVTPLGASKDVFWKRIAGGESAIGFLSGNNKGFCVKIGAEVKENIPERLTGYDRASQFSILAARSAVKDAGLDLDIIGRDNVGTAITSSKGNVAIVERLRAAVNGDLPGNIFYADPNTAVAADLGLRGPFLSAVSACSTGAHSIAGGADMIRRGDAGVVLAGSSEASITNFILAGFKKMGVLAEENVRADDVFRPFDRDRKGFVIGEGAGVVVLEPFEKAVRRKAHIYGELCGWANAADAFHVTSFNPDSETIAEAIRIALARAGMEKVDYVNCHGTATKKNDTIETLGIKKGFGKKARDISLSATKPMTGHLLGAGGSVEFIISLLAMENGFVPPTLNLEVPDPSCDLDYTPKKGVRRDINSVMSLSFGFGGHIGALVAKK